MDSNELVSKYFMRTMIIVNQLRRYGDRVEDVRVMEKILRSLDPKFYNIVGTVEEAKDLNTLTVDELLATLEIHEQRINRRLSTTGHEQALQVMSRSVTRGGGGGMVQRGRGRGRGFGQARGRGGRNFQGGRGQEENVQRGRGRNGGRRVRGRMRGVDKIQVQCYRCNEYGHFSRECTAHVECYECGEYGHYSYDCTEEDADGEVGEHANIATEKVDATVLQAEVIEGESKGNVL
ncbi:hypothetical protein Vadar_029851 [Vaccinium darrowii]|uniref:Uncharacterized protein n=1 Tax=Vaccinium darrowii TaxID=229202 RepID=A0ACB7XVG7_9ERIC|nr:hypothetical protein Vadar_029851 [Vaccinium darrowii]